MQRIHLSMPRLGGKEVLHVNNAFVKNQTSIYGENIAAFENSLTFFLKKNIYIALTNSGTSALHLALILSEVESGDEVLCQSFTFSASANPIVYQGAKPVFIDSETDTWNMCPIALVEAIKNRVSVGKKPKAIIVVHLYGMPAKMDEIAAIAKKYNINLIEDAAEALGSSYKGQKCGTFGDYGVFSFNGNKIITTSGGGALVCKSRKDKQKAIFLATQARENTTHYQHSEVGYNYRMSNILAGIGRGQMEIFDLHLQLRRKNHLFYEQLFEGVKGITVFKEPSKDYFSNHWLSCVLINDSITGFTREDLRLQLEKDNIESRPLWKPMHLQPVFKDCLYFGNKVADFFFEKGLCLPSGSNLKKGDLKRIAQSIKKLLES